MQSSPHTRAHIYLICKWFAELFVVLHSGFFSTSFGDGQHFSSIDKRTIWVNKSIRCVLIEVHTMCIDCSCRSVCLSINWALSVRNECDIGWRQSSNSFQYVHSYRHIHCLLIINRKYFNLFPTQSLAEPKKPCLTACPRIKTVSFMINCVQSSIYFRPIYIAYMLCEVHIASR